MYDWFLNGHEFIWRIYDMSNFINVSSLAFQKAKNIGKNSKVKSLKLNQGVWIPLKTSVNEWNCTLFTKSKVYQQ